MVLRWTGLWLGYVVVIALASAQPGAPGGSWQSGFRLFLMSPHTVSGGSGASNAPTVARPNRNTVVYRPRRPARPAQVHTEDGHALQADAFIHNGRTYVALRQFLEELRDKYGIDIGVEYEAPNQVRIHLRDDELWFGRGMAHLWAGRVKEALEAFERAARLKGEFAQPAKELAAWIREGTDPTKLNTLGVIRIEWWNLPAEVRVFINEVEVPYGAPLMIAPDGVYTLRLVNPHGQEIFTQDFRVRLDRAFVVKFRQSS